MIHPHIALEITTSTTKTTSDTTDINENDTPQNLFLLLEVLFKGWTEMISVAGMISCSVPVPISVTLIGTQFAFSILSNLK